MDDNPQTTRRAPSVVTLLLLAGFILPVPTLCCGCLNHDTVLGWLNRVPFDSTAWKEAPTEERYNLAWDQRCGLPNGKSTQEVADLLGGPNITEVIGNGLPLFDAHARQGSLVWYYYLGHERYQFSLRPEGAVLSIEFGEGKVVQVRKIAH